MTPTMIEGGIKSNSVPEMCRITCDVRTLPHQDDGYTRSELEGILEGIDGVANRHRLHGGTRTAQSLRRTLLSGFSEATSLSLDQAGPELDTFDFDGVYGFEVPASAGDGHLWVQRIAPGG